MYHQVVMFHQSHEDIGVMYHQSHEEIGAAQPHRISLGVLEYTGSGQSIGPTVGKIVKR